MWDDLKSRRCPDLVPADCRPHPEATGQTLYPKQGICRIRAVFLLTTRGVGGKKDFGCRKAIHRMRLGLALPPDRSVCIRRLMTTTSSQSISSIVSRFLVGASSTNLQRIGFRGRAALRMSGCSQWRPKRVSGLLELNEGDVCVLRVISMSPLL